MLAFAKSWFDQQHTKVLLQFCYQLSCCVVS